MTPTRAELLMLIKKPQKMEILIRWTPQLAQWVLETCNADNRTLRAAHVARLAAQMKRGDFYLTHQSIAFDVMGNLQDGQHRLAACIESGASFDAYCRFGMPVRNRKIVDLNRTRTGSDIFCMEKIPNYNNAVAVTRALNRLNGCDPIYNPDDIQKMYEKFGAAEVQDAIHHGKSLARALETKNRTSCAALFYLFAKKNYQKACAFFEKTADTSNLPKNSPMLKTNKLLHRATIKQASFEGTLINGWNAFMGRRAAVTEHKEDDPLPEILG